MSFHFNYHIAGCRAATSEIGKSLKGNKWCGSHYAADIVAKAKAPDTSGGHKGKFLGCFHLATDKWFGNANAMMVNIGSNEDAAGMVKVGLPYQAARVAVDQQAADACELIPTGGTYLIPAVPATRAEADGTGNAMGAERPQAADVEPGKVMSFANEIFHIISLLL